MGIKGYQLEKACPFCGGEAVCVPETYFDDCGEEDILCWRAYCKSCGIVTRGFPGAGQVEELWNSRVDLSQKLGGASNGN